MLNIRHIMLIFSLFFSAHRAYSDLIVGIGSTPNNLDPHFATDANSQDINRLIHLSLIDAGPKMNSVCRACEKFEEKRSADGSHRIRFWLRPNLRFHDGSKLTAKHVVASTDKLLANKNAPIPTLFKELVGAKFINDYEVELQFSKYVPENLTNLALLKITNDVGSAAGKYRVVSKSESAIIIEGPERIEFKVVADETTMALKLINGEVDVIATSMSPRKIEWLGKQDGIKLFEQAGTNYVYIAPLHRHPDLKNRDVRRALSHLIPREDLAKYKQKNTVVLAEGMFSSAFEGLHLERGAIAFDPLKAQALLKSAGYEFKDKRWHKDGRILEFTLKISNKKHIIELANALVPYFESAGIGLRVQAAEWGTFYRDLKAGNFDLALGQWVGFVGPDQMGFTFLESSIPPGGANRGFYVDAEFEKYYGMAVNAKNQQVALENYRKAYTRVIEDEAYISLWHPKIIWATRDCVTKLEPYPTGNFLAFEGVEHACRH